MPAQMKLKSDRMVAQNFLFRFFSLAALSSRPHEHLAIGADNNSTALVTRNPIPSLHTRISRHRHWRNVVTKTPAAVNKHQHQHNDCTRITTCRRRKPLGAL
jgi:hypothetical protein